MEGSPRWFFERDGSGLWRWTRTEADSRTVSNRSFEAHKECVLDAIRYAVQLRRSGAEGRTE
jgi:hypothetical protein